jgi:3',5'-cyclic-nucleotide phosphodiesterase
VRKKQRTTPAAPADVRGALEGLRVFVIHCKDTLDGSSDRPNQTLIIEEIKRLVEQKSLGAEILAARQGMRIGEPYSYLPPHLHEPLIAYATEI